MLKDGRECCLRNGEESDAQAVIDNFNLTHAQTDYLLSYPAASPLEFDPVILGWDEVKGLRES